MTRRRIIIATAIGALAIGLGWVLMVNLSRVLRTAEPAPAAVATPAQTMPEPAAAVPRITATLFFASADGRGLVAVQQEVAMAEGTVAQARALVEAQLSATAPAPLASTMV